MSTRDWFIATVVLVVVIAFILFGLSASSKDPDVSPDTTVTEQTTTVIEP